MAGQHPLHISGIHGPAICEEAVGDPVHDPDISLLVPAGRVTGPEPAVRRQDLAGGLGVACKIRP